MTAQIIDEIGETGARMVQLRAVEGGAGNLSVLHRTGWPGFEQLFPQRQELELPVQVPRLAGMSILVTGSGCRLHDLERRPFQNMGLLYIRPGGQRAWLHTHPGRAFTRLTIELNSHLVCLEVLAVQSRATMLSVLHVQPPHLTYLSHMPHYRKPGVLSQALLRWQPEMIVQFPQGIEVLPYELPGTLAQSLITGKAMQHSRMVVWSKHGVICGAEKSPLVAADKVEYAEAAAHYELINLLAGERADGLQPDELRHLAATFGIQQTVF